MGVWWCQKRRLAPMGVDFIDGFNVPRFETARIRNRGRARPGLPLLRTERWSLVEEDRENRRAFAGRLGDAPRWRPYCARPVRRRAVKRRGLL